MVAVTVGLLTLPQAGDPARLLSGVSVAEQARFSALRQRPRRARQYLASRWLLRAHLGHELGLPPHALPLQHARNGPPALIDSDWHIGLSHSGDCCLCIVSPHLRVGCDVELHRTRTRAPAIAAAYFDPAEAKHLQTAPAACAQRDFYRLWTLKEAALKALGQGLAGGLRSPAFALVPALRCLHAPAGGAWTFASCQATYADSDYTMALAMNGANTPVPLRVMTYAASPTGAVRRDCQLRWEITT